MIRDNDVLCVKGGSRKFHEHIGNLHYTALVKKHSGDYVAAGRDLDEKTRITRLIVDQVRNSKGCFLRKDKNSKWEDIGFENSMKKVKKALSRSKCVRDNQNSRSEHVDESSKKVAETEDDTDSITTMGDHESVDLLSPTTSTTIKTNTHISKNNCRNTSLPISSILTSSKSSPKRSETSPDHFANILISLQTTQGRVPETSTTTSPKKSSSCALSPKSPATQTLDVLSQHDAIGGGDLRYESERNSSNTGYAPKQSGFTFTRPNHTATGAKSKYIHSRDGSLHDNDNDNEEPEIRARHERDNGKHPYQKNDLKCVDLSVNKSESSDCQECENRKTTGLFGCYPHHKKFCKLSPFHADNVQKRKDKDGKHVVSDELSLSESDSEDVVEIVSAEHFDTDRVPFCLFCNANAKEKEKKNIPHHHALCPKHEEFTTSGGEEKLEIIRNGIQKGCESCKFHYENGFRAKHLKHKDTCERHQMGGSSKPKKAVDEDNRKKKNGSSGVKKPPRSSVETGREVQHTLSSAEEVKYKKLYRDAVEKGTKQGCKKCKKHNEGQMCGGLHKSTCPGQQCVFLRKGVEAGCQLCIRDLNGNRAGSEKRKYEHSKKCPKRKQAVDRQKETPLLPVTRHTNEAVNGQRKKQRKVDPPKDRTEISGSSTQISVTPSPASVAGYIDPHFSICEDDAKAHWVPCTNPWGQMGHEEGDLVLFSCSKSQILEESMQFNVNRFSMYPFSEESSYRRTHFGPERGYTTCVLARDRMALRPWGFSFRYHEFGGGCLINTVEPMSPAETAVLLGTVAAKGSIHTDSGLQENDLILCVNGKCVGGMTANDLHLELEVCGPELILVVARCKIPANGSNMQQNTPPNGRLLDWNDMGPGISSYEKSLNNHGDPLNTDYLGTASISDPPRSESVLGRRIHREGETSHAFLSSHNRNKHGDNRPGLNEYEENDSSDIAMGIYAGTHRAASPTLDDALDDSGHGDAMLESIVMEKSSSGIANTKQKAPQIELDEETLPDLGHENQRDGANKNGLYLSQKHFEAENSGQSSNRKANTKEKKTKAISKEIVDSDDEWDDDEDPWLGCVCGVTHEEPISVFWIQCDRCETWYDVATKCVGFTKEEAVSIKVWNCWCCGGSFGAFDGSKRTSTVALPKSQEIEKRGNSGDKDRVSDFKIPDRNLKRYNNDVSFKRGKSDSNDVTTCNNNMTTPTKVQRGDSFVYGTLIHVEPRTGPGLNKEGGVGCVIGINEEDGDIFYDIKYVLGGREFGVESKYVTLHQQLSGTRSVEKRLGSQGSQ